MRSVRSPDFLLVSEIIDKAEYTFSQVEQWRSSPWNTAFTENQVKYLHQLEALVELLEGHQGGSWGGHNDGHHGSMSLRERLDWVKEHALSSTR